MSRVIKRSIALGGYQTSMTLEHEFFMRLKELARMRHLTLSELVAQIGQTREGNLSSAVRVYILEHEAERCGIVAVTGGTPSIHSTA